MQYVDEDLDVVNTTTHPSIIRPLSVQLTEQGHIQLNYPDTVSSHAKGTFS
jgi:hypothetical protein